MKVTVLDSFNPGENAFLQDIELMGTRVGLRPEPAEGLYRRVLIMHRHHVDAIAPWIIVVDEATGERIKIEFTEV